VLATGTGDEPESTATLAAAGRRLGRLRLAPAGHRLNPGVAGAVGGHKPGNPEEGPAVRPVEWPLGQVRETPARNRRSIDPELSRQLKAAGAGQDVSAAISLRPDSARPPEPEETRHRVTTLLQRVERETGERPSASTIFENLGSFAIAAPAGFIERLLAQPEIATATANFRQEDLLIRPVERGPAVVPRPGRRS